jgi:hypothetical protein
VTTASAGRPTPFSPMSDGPAEAPMTNKSLPSARSGPSLSCPQLHQRTHSSTATTSTYATTRSATTNVGCMAIGAPAAAPWSMPPSKPGRRRQPRPNRCRVALHPLARPSPHQPCAERSATRATSTAPGPSPKPSLSNAEPVTHSLPSLRHTTARTRPGDSLCENRRLVSPSPPEIGP